MSFPEERPRRLRRTGRLRAMVRETRVTPEQLVYPLFVTPGTGVRKEISSLPGCFHLSVDEVAREAEEVERLGIGGVILFGLPEGKDPLGSEGYALLLAPPRHEGSSNFPCRIRDGTSPPRHAESAIRPSL